MTRAALALLVVAACESDKTIVDNIADASPVDAAIDAPPLGLACPDGFQAIADRTSCASDVVDAPAAFAMTSAPAGTIVSMAGLDEGALPCLPALVCAPSAGDALVFSDDPETVATDGVLYADPTIGPGFVRVYVYHVNGGAAARKFPVVLLAQGTTAVNVTILAKAVGAPSTDYVTEGKIVAAQFLASTGIEASVVVPSHTRVLLDAELDAAHANQGELVHAIYDLQLDGQVKLSVVSVGANVDAAAATAGLSLVPNDGAHDRGTFPHATLAFATSAAPGARHLRLGDGTTEPELVGRDATTNTPATLHGNYGVTYLVATPGHLALSARGGTWAGAGAGGATLGPLSTTTDAIWLGQASALITGGGSSLPVDLIVLPH